jgi:DNA-binding Xre family transcriptional regulator
LEIRSSDLSGVLLSEKYGVSTSTISLIRNGKGWKHVVERTHGS